MKEIKKNKLFLIAITIFAIAIIIGLISGSIAITKKLHDENTGLSRSIIEIIEHANQKTDEQIAETPLFMIELINMTRFGYNSGLSVLIISALLIVPILLVFIFKQWGFYNPSQKISITYFVVAIIFLTLIIIFSSLSLYYATITTDQNWISEYILNALKNNHK